MLISLGHFLNCPSSAQPPDIRTVTKAEEGGAIYQLHCGGAGTPLVGENPWSNNTLEGPTPSPCDYPKIAPLHRKLTSATLSTDWWGSSG